MNASTAPSGSSPRPGAAYTQQQYAERFNVLGPAGEHWFRFPGNDGAARGTRLRYTSFDAFVRDFGQQLDRIGDEDAKQLILMPDGRPASWEQRAHHVHFLTTARRCYLLHHLPAEWQIEISELARAFGQPGGALQVHLFDENERMHYIDDLLDVGVLRRAAA